MNHGTQHAYRRRGCRCDECRAWKAADMAAYRRRRQYAAAERAANIVGCPVADVMDPVEPS